MRGVIRWDQDGKGGQIRKILNIGRSGEARSWSKLVRAIIEEEDGIVVVQCGIMISV